MADRIPANEGGRTTTDIGADGVARTISGWTWAMVGVLIVVVLIGALLLGGFFSMGQRGQKINSENSTSQRPAEPC
jgi:hypothetical protein